MTPALKQFAAIGIGGGAGLAVAGAALGAAGLATEGGSAVGASAAGGSGPSAAELAAAQTANAYADAVASGDTAAAQTALKGLIQTPEGQAYLQTVSQTANSMVQNAQALGLTPAEVAGAQNVAKITNLLGNVGTGR